MYSFYEIVIHKKSVTIGSALERFSCASSFVNVREIISSISGVNLTHKSTDYLSKKITSYSETELALRVTLYGNAGYSSARVQYALYYLVKFSVLHMENFLINQSY